jgi:Stress responsive A/B Barrel Domain
MAGPRNGRVRHSVVFRLGHAEGSVEQADFLAAISALRGIAGVEDFELLREVSPKNDFQFALTMEFANQSLYDAYNAHPDHVDFVASRWASEVVDFLEVDTMAM